MLKNKYRGIVRHLQRYILPVILLLAAFLRLYRIEDYMTFLGDEGRDVLVVKHILEGKLTLLGPTASVGGFFFGPIYYYFMTPFLWLFNYNPVGPAVMVALFGVATVFLVYVLGKTFFNKDIGFIAAFLYAISPVIIAYSRSSWNPNLVPFFSFLTIYCIYQAAQNNNLKLFLLAGVFLGIDMELHFISGILGLIIVLYLLFLHLTEKGSGVSGLLKRYFVIGVGFVIGWLPYLGFEVRHAFPNTKSIFAFVFHSGEVSRSNNFFATVGDVFFRIFGRLITAYPPPEQAMVQKHPNIIPWFWFTVILGIFATVLFLVKVIKVLRGENKSQINAYVLLFLWLLCGIFLFGFYRKQIYDYYFGFMYAIPFLLTSFFMLFLWNKERILRLIAIVLFVLLFLLNLAAMPFWYPPNRQLAQVRRISKVVFEQAEGKPFNFALMTSGNSDHAYRYFFELWGNSPVTIQNSVVDPQRKTVTGQLLVVCESLPCHPLGDSLWEIAGFGRAEIVGEWDVSVVKVFKLKHFK